MNSLNQPQTGMQLYDAEGRRLYFTENERRAWLERGTRRGFFTLSKGMDSRIFQA
jgi:hypothetical protein